MNSSFLLGKVMGIPLKLHLTFLLILPWVALIFATESPDLLGKPFGFYYVQPDYLRWIYSFASALLLFVCVVLHELGHSFVAKKYGIKIKGITLYLFGGVASMEEIPRNPSLEMRMSLAGPMVSGIIGLAMILVYGQFAGVLGVQHPFPILLWTLGSMNLVLMVFNLIPAFPMDGGRILRAWFATRMSYVRATRQAAGIGKLFAMLLGFLGLMSLNFITLIIALFVYVGASEEEKATAISVNLEGILVKHIMSKDVRTIDPDMDLKELMDLMFREKHRGYPVLVDGVLKGIVTITDLQRVPETVRESTRVGDVMSRDIYVIGPEVEAIAAMKVMSEKKIRRLPVINNGHLVGIISREDLVRAIELCSNGRY